MTSTKKPQTTTSSPSQSSEFSRKRIDRLFLKFAACYGPVWRSQFKHDDFLEFAKKEWHQALLEFEDGIIEQAIAACLAGRELPPTMPQFMDLCRSAKKRHAFAPINRDHKPRNLEVAFIHLHKMKQLLNR
ncbi:Vir protein [Legionella spiritensis]|uniref:Vir protein n=1 Tax=Legionella spiritensis TaxID=452 RepID=UPI001055F2F7|nr:Vir protein [Legionella spiritensis]